jgi:uncharacterized protein (DUF433 family)
MTQSKTYVEQHDGGYWIAGTRISLDSVVYAFQRGAAPESIVRSFPLLTLEQVYGAITFYLAHEQLVNDYLRQGEATFEALRHASANALRDAAPELVERIEQARELSRPTTQ